MPASQSRVAFPLVVALLLGFETYALFFKRSGETAYVPPAAQTSLTEEIAGDATLSQTFVMHVDGFDAIGLYAVPSAGTPLGDVELTLIGDTYAAAVGRQRVPVAVFLADKPFFWTIPRVDQSAGRSYTLRVAMPDTPAGRGLRFEMGGPHYLQGELSVAGRPRWGDLKFRTRAARARLVDSLRDVRRHAPGPLRSDAVLVVAALLFNAALLTVIRSGWRDQGRASSPRSAPESPSRATGFTRAGSGGS